MTEPHDTAIHVVAANRGPLLFRNYNYYISIMGGVFVAVLCVAIAVLNRRWPIDATVLEVGIGGVALFGGGALYAVRYTRRRYVIITDWSSYCWYSDSRQAVLLRRYEAALWRYTGDAIELSRGNNVVRVPMPREAAVRLCGFLRDWKWPKAEVA